MDGLPVDGCATVRVHIKYGIYRGATSLTRGDFPCSAATGLAPWTTKALLMARGSTEVTDKSDA